MKAASSHHPLSRICEEEEDDHREDDQAKTLSEVTPLEDVSVVLEEEGEIQLLADRDPEDPLILLGLECQCGKDGAPAADHDDELVHPRKKKAAAASPWPHISREEVEYLAMKLRELELMAEMAAAAATGNEESVISCGRNDSGFNSDHPSLLVAADGGHSEDGGSRTGSEIPSADFGNPSDLHSGFLENYGLDGPVLSNPEPALGPPSGTGGQHQMEAFLEAIPLPSATSTNTKKKRKEELKQATIRQHYYPEGGWGWVIVAMAFMVKALVQGFQMSHGVILACMARRFDFQGDFGTEQAAVFLGVLSVGLSHLLSPLTVGVCRRKSTRLTGVLGGLVSALGCLFSSFASQFHQLFLSHGVIMGTALSAWFLSEVTNSLGWRLGLQASTGLLVMPFFLGLFYRSASLYHPQRRAILHLKTQKRKIKTKDKEKSKLADDTPPFFDFSTLKSRTFQLMLLATGLSFLGINAPVLLLAPIATREGLPYHQVVALICHIGVSWSVGVIAFGVIIVNNSTDCRISRQHLCQASLFLLSLAVFSTTKLRGYNGYLIFAWLYGLFYGGFVYSLKMYIYEKVRAKNFARAWSLAQCVMGVATLVGVPITMLLNNCIARDDASNVQNVASVAAEPLEVTADQGKFGFYFCAVLLLLSSVSLFLVDVHKRRIRRRKKRRLCHSKSIVSTTTFNSSTSCPTHSAAHSTSGRSTRTRSFTLRSQSSKQSHMDNGKHVTGDTHSMASQGTIPRALAGDRDFDSTYSAGSVASKNNASRSDSVAVADPPSASGAELIRELLRNQYEEMRQLMLEKKRREHLRRRSNELLRAPTNSVHDDEDDDEDDGELVHGVDALLRLNEEGEVILADMDEELLELDEVRRGQSRADEDLDAEVLDGIVASSASCDLDHSCSSEQPMPSEASVTSSIWRLFKGSKSKRKSSTNSQHLSETSAAEEQSAAL